MKSDPRGGTGGEIEGGVWRKGEDDFETPASGSGAPKKIETMPREELSSGATDDEEWLSEEERRSLSQSAEDQRKTLRKRGYDEDQIEEIVAMSQGQAKDYLRRAKGRDAFPINRTQGGRGGHFGGERRPGEHADGKSAMETAREYMRQIDEGDERRKVADDQMEMGTEPSRMNAPTSLIMDWTRRPRGSRSSQAVDEIHRQLRRFGPPAGAEPERYRGTSGKLPSEAQREELHRLVPGLALIGDMWGDGPGVSSHRNPYEV